jgi:hypothetical protein
MSDVKRLSDDGSGRYKAKTVLFVVAITLGIVGLQWARRPTDMVVDALVLLVIVGCLVWSLRSTVWYVADSVELADRRLTIRRGRRKVTVDLTQIVDVARAGWMQPGAIVLALRSPLDGLGDTVTYRIAGAGSATTAEEIAVVAELRREIGLAPVADPEVPLTPDDRSRLKLKRWGAGLVVVLYLPILANMILELNLFAPYDRMVSALAMVVMFVIVYFGFSQREWDAISDSRRRARK